MYYKTVDNDLVSHRKINNAPFNISTLPIAILQIVVSIAGISIKLKTIEAETLILWYFSY